MKKKFIVKLHREKCIGCGACAVINSKHFEITEEGISHLKDSKLDGSIEILGSEEEPITEDYELFMECEENCPVSAIKIEEINKNK